MMKWIGRLGLLVLIGLVCLVGVLLWNTARYTLAPTAQSTGGAPLLRVGAERVAAKLGNALRHQTVSSVDPNSVRKDAFTAFLDQIADDFPRVHAQFERRLISGLTPVFHWQGRDPSLPPVLLIGHYDVVPPLLNNRSQWAYPPFDGAVAEGHVWGRGALDNKGAVISALEAAELMLETGFTPERSVWFAFGHDEEVGGARGAQQVVSYFQSQGVQFEWVLDEGSMVLDGIVPGLAKPLASINTAEKGYMSVDLVARSEGGHSSLPTDELSVEILAEALVNLRDNPVPGEYDGVTKAFFDAIGPAMPFGQRVAFANSWITRGVLASALSGANTTNAMLRTTTAPTMLQASPRENVLPSEARATINFRLHPRDTVDGVLAHLRDVIADERVDVVHDGSGRPASAVSRVDSAGYALLSSTASAVFGDVIVAPGLTIAALDARHYQVIADDIYRFNPFLFDASDLPRLHGLNERVSIDNLVKAVQFYAAVIAAQ